MNCAQELQQYLPFTVLKRLIEIVATVITAQVATVLTVYGIETPMLTYSIEQ